MADALNLVFDLDGTLIDSLPSIHFAANKVFEYNGLPDLPEAVVRDAIGNGVGVLVTRLLQYSMIDETAHLHQKLVSELVDLYEAAHDLTSLYPGVRGALEDLNASGHHLGLCTNKPVGPALSVLRHFRLEGLFKVVIGGDSLPHRKPDPRPLQATIAALDGMRSVFVGDSEVDAETAQAARIPFALFTGGYRKAPAETMGAKLIFDDHAALPQLIQHLAARL